MYLLLLTLISVWSTAVVATPTHQNNQASPENIEIVHKKHNKKTWSSSLSTTFKTTTSTSIRLLLALILGILLSLTPCIYPMIPITAGILHGYGKRSLLANFARSLIYTGGLATTYAVFGLLASCSGPLYGRLLAQPIFVYSLVLFLAYLGFAMLGMYDMYIPRFMQPSSSTTSATSWWTLFILGLASGTIASPCVSPGLALILGVVAQLGNLFIGFLMLFVFGIGLSMPLLIIGTFSGAMNYLPRAGIWMQEIKRLFGLLILGMCFYYISGITATHIVLWLMSLTAAAIGIFYIVIAQQLRSSVWRMLDTCISIALLAGSVVLAVQAYQQSDVSCCSCHGQEHSAQKHQKTVWLTSYQDAHTQAQTEHKLLFIDVWAQFCSTCKAINKTLLADKQVLEALQKKYVLLSVDGSSANSEPYKTIHAQYHIQGFPAFLIVDPVTGKELKRYDSKLYGMDPEIFIAKMAKHAAM